MNSRCSILIVEDYVEMQEVLTFVLERNGYKVCCLSKGKEALEILAALSIFNLIILDHNLTDMNSIEFLTQLKGLKKWNSAPVLICSAEINRADYEQFDSLIVGFLKKPFQVQELLKLLSDLTGGPDSSQKGPQFCD